MVMNLPPFAILLTNFVLDAAGTDALQPFPNGLEADVDKKGVCISRRKTGRSVTLVLVLLGSGAALIALCLVNPEDMGFKLLALLLFFVCIYLGLRERYPFNPYFFFSLTPLSLALYEYKFSTYYLDRLDSYTYAVALCGIAAFIFGLSLIKRSFKAYVCHRDGSRAESLFYPLLVLGMLPVVYGVLRAPGVLLSGDFIGMSEYTGLMPMSSILMFCRFPALALAFKSRRKGRSIVALGCCAIALLLSFNKTNLIFLVFTLLLSIHRYCLMSSRSRNVFRLLCIAAALGLVASVTFYDDVRGDFDSTAALVSRGSSGLPEFLMLPYMYLECSWTNLQYVIDTQPVHTFGLWLLRPLLFYFRVDGAFDDAYVLIPSSSYNTYTYLTVLWKDFGLIGAIIISFCLGLFVSFVYQKFRHGDSPFLTAAYALNAVAVLEMFFSNHFFYLVYPFTAIIIAQICDAYAGYIAKRHHAADDGLQLTNKLSCTERWK